MAALSICGNPPVSAENLNQIPDRKNNPFLFAQEGDICSEISDTPIQENLYSDQVPLGIAVQVASSRRSEKADQVSWDSLKNITLKAGRLTQFDRETVKTLNNPPVREQYSSWRALKKDVYRWAEKLLRLGADGVELAQNLASRSFRSSPTLELLSESLGEIHVSDLMKSLDSYGSQQLRSLITSFERHLPSIERWPGMIPSDYSDSVSESW